MGIIERKKSILLNTPHIVTASGSIASFNTDMKAPLKECKIHFLPVQSGSGDPSPDNVRPITGWTGVNACLTGNNIWDEVLVEGALGSNGTIIGGSTRRTTSFIPVKGGSTYFFRGPSKAAYGRIAYYDKDKNPIYVDTSTGIPIGILTARDGACYMRVTLGSYYGTVYGNDISFNYPSSDTVYHAYEGNEIQQVSFGDNGTIYGGYVDLVSGELVAEYAYWYDNGHLTPAINKYTSYNRIVYPGNQLPEMPKNSSTSTLKCNYFKSSSNATPWNAFFGSTGNFLAYIPTSFETAKQWKEYLVDNPLEICYELETPITYQLTPQQLKSLKGINNIWSDANDITEVKFWKH